MAIIEEQAKHVAKLSKLSFSEEKLTDFTNQLDKVIDMVKLLEGVDTAGVPFTSNANKSINVMCEDIATSGMDRKGLMRSVPGSENDYIKVPAIVDNGEAGA